MTDFIREVDEDLRQERFKQTLNRYWYVIAAALVLILGGVGAWKAFDYTRTQKAEAAGGQYLTALDLARDGKSDDAITALKTVEAEGTPGYRLLARFRLAGETGAKDPAAGATLFDALAADATVDPALQTVARLRAALLLLDKLPYADFKTRMEPLADANNPLRNAAREMLALSALKVGEAKDAGRDLDAIDADPTASGALRQRVQALQALVRSAGSAAPAVTSVPPAPAPVAPEPQPPSASPDSPAK